MVGGSRGEANLLGKDRVRVRAGDQGERQWSVHRVRACLLDAEELVAVVLHAVGVGGDLVVLLLHLLLVRLRLLVLRPRERQHGREE